MDERDGAKYVRNDFYLAAAADIVVDPSAPSAFVQGIMEGKEWVWNHGSLVEAHVAEVKEVLMLRNVKDKRMKQAFRFLSSSKIIIYKYI